MLALLLYLWLGPRAALMEVMVELVIGLAVIGGGGGRRFMLTLRALLEGMRRRRPVVT